MIIRLLRLILLGIIIYLFYKFFWKGNTRDKRRRSNPKKAIEEMKKDPVCGTYIPENQAIKYKRAGQVFYFCSVECREKFQALEK